MNKCYRQNKVLLALLKTEQQKNLEKILNKWFLENKKQTDFV